MPLVSWDSMLFIITFHDVHFYIDDMENMIINKRDDFESYLEESQDQMTPDEFDEFLNNHLDELQMYRESYFNISRRSSFLVLYTLFEKYLFDVSKRFQEQNDIKTSIREYNTHDKGISKVKTYVKKKCNCNFPSHTPEWNKITMYNTIRNSIAHQWGEVDSNLPVHERKPLVNAIRGLPHVSMTDKGEIIFDKDFNREFYKTIKEFSYLLD